MKIHSKRLLKSLILGLIIFLAINWLDKSFYDFHAPSGSPVLRFYFYPILILADLINFIIPIDQTLFHKTLINPHHYNFPIPKSQGNFHLPSIYTLITGVLWTSLIVYFSPFIEKIKKADVFLILVLTVTATVILTMFFGLEWRYLPYKIRKWFVLISTTFNLIWFFLITIYYKRIKKTDPFLRGVIYLLTILFLIQISSSASQFLFGSWYERACSGCP